MPHKIAVLDLGVIKKRIRRVSQEANMVQRTDAVDGGDPDDSDADA